MFLQQHHRHSSVWKLHSFLDLIVLVCLGFTLMFVNNIADAQGPYQLTVEGVRGADYNLGDTPTITYTLVDSSGTPQPGVTIKLTPTGLQILTPERTTNEDGQLEVRIRFLFPISQQSLVAEPQPVSKYAVQVVMRLCCSSIAAEDINQDGRVDILDLVVVAQSIGSARPHLHADVNDDGVVDVLDLVAVAGSPHWGEPVATEKVREPNAAAPE